MNLRVYKTDQHIVVEQEKRLYRLPGGDWNELFTAESPRRVLDERLRAVKPSAAADLSQLKLAPPIGDQEVWAAGVTYYRSREARMHEAQDAGAGDFYDRVYQAERPELFFKSTPHRTVGPGQKVRIRRDSRWNVPEPEVTLAVSAAGRIFGYTIGNDMSSRDIEGENPLYLPQAKVYDGCCALGPCLYLTDEPLPPDTEIRLEISRGKQVIFVGTTQLSQMKRPFEHLVEYLYRDNSFPCGCYLLTGTGIVPPEDFSLEPNDEVRITVLPIGTLVNTVERG